MRISYGVPGNYVDVTEHVISRETDGIMTISDNYNEIFDDVCPGVKKRMVIEMSDLPPISVEENTPLVISTSICPVSALYIVDDRYDYLEDVKYLEEMAISGVTVYIEIGNRTVVPSTMSGFIVTRHYVPMVKNGREIMERLCEEGDFILLYMRTLPNDILSGYVRKSILHEWKRNIKIMERLTSIDVITYYMDGVLPCSSCFWTRSENVRKNHQYHISNTLSLYGTLSPNIGVPPSSDISPRHSIDEDRYLDINAYRPGHGFLNQINNLCSSILVANVTGRKIYNPIFYPSYQSIYHLPLSWVVDIPHLNNMLFQMRMTTRVIESNEKRIFHVWEQNHHPVVSISTLDNVVSMLELENEHTNLYIGCSIPRLSVHPIVTHVMKGMRFLPIYHEVAKYCMSVIGDSYHSVHLRMEDDWINVVHGVHGSFTDVSVSLWRYHKEAMEKSISKSDRVFIATHLGKAPNGNNHLLDELRLLYPNVVTYIPWREKYDLPQGREIDALIDYLICLGGRSFIGTSGSTFSDTIALMFLIDNLPVHLI